jgi:hypothetical protein
MNEKRKKKSYSDGTKPIESTSFLPKSQKRTQFYFNKDENIFKLHVEQGIQDWKFISTHFNFQYPKSCLDRFYSYSDPNLNREDWTEEEDINRLNFK